MASKLSEHYLIDHKKWVLKTVREHFNNTANTKEGIKGQKLTMTKTDFEDL